MNKDTSLNIADWDEHDFRTFIKTHAAVFRLFAGRYLRDEDTIRDILQESFVKLWTRREKIGEVKSVRNYCYSIIKNTIFDHLQRIAKERPEDVSQRYGQVAGDDETFVRNMIEAESARMIAQAINTLSPQSRRVLLLTLKGEKIKDIAATLGISVNTVKTIKYRAFDRLQKQLFELRVQN